MLIDNSKKIVIKLGSTTVIDKKGNFKKDWVNSLIKDIKKYKKKEGNCNSIIRCNCAWTKLFKDKKKEN